MGTTLIYRTGWALLFETDFSRGMRSGSNSSILSVPCNWTDTTGASHSTVYGYSNISMLGGYMTTPYATSTTKDTFSATDYAPATVDNVTVTNVYSSDGGAFTDDHISRTTNFTFTNSGETEATVNSLTIGRSLFYGSSSGATALSFCYVFDTPITLSAGESKTISFTWGFKF